MRARALKTMASTPVYSASFSGTTINYYVGLSADAGENLRQFGQLVEDFKPHGLTLGNYLFIRGPGGRPVSFSAGLRGDFEIVSTIGSCFDAPTDPCTAYICCRSPPLIQAQPR